jgi:hypothetical protein
MRKPPCTEFFDWLRVRAIDPGLIKDDVVRSRLHLHHGEAVDVGI